jgi:hypothetical protein
MKVKALFGDMVFIGDIAYVDEVIEEKEIEEDLVDEYMVKNHFNGYLIPSQFSGQIIYGESK